MIKNTAITLSLLALVSMQLHAQFNGKATRSAYRAFDPSKDLLVAQFDSLPDPDDVHSQAALGCMLLHPDLAGVKVIAVLGATGRQNSADFKDSSALLELIYGPEGVIRNNRSWTKAWDGHKVRGAHWNLSVDRVKALVRPTLEGGGIAWVQEAGQSNITADWVAELIADGVPRSLIRNNVIVVQHSNWNHNKTDAIDREYINATVTYVKIEDGNSANSTPDYSSTDAGYLPEARSAANPNPTARRYWQKVGDVLQVTGDDGGSGEVVAGGVDFSDCSENWWIFDIGTKADTIRKFWDRYVVNNHAGDAMHHIGGLPLAGGVDGNFSHE